MGFGDSAEGAALELRLIEKEQGTLRGAGSAQSPRKPCSAGPNTGSPQDELLGLKPYEHSEAPVVNDELGCVSRGALWRVGQGSGILNRLK